MVVPPKTTQIGSSSNTLLMNTFLAVATGSIDDITALLGDGTDLFIAISVLAVLVTGFFLGRKWIKKI